MSQEELAEKLEVSRQTVSNWENDKAVLDAVKLAKICTVFGVRADDMLNGEGIPTPVTQNEDNHKRTAGKKRTLTIIIFAIIALVFIVIAAVGFIFGKDKVSATSLITIHSDYIWIALLVIGIAALIGMVVAFLKKK